MRFRRLAQPLVALATVTIAAAAAAEPAAGPPPPQAFGTLPRADDVSLSPDGKSIAWVDGGAKPERIIVYDLVANKDRRMFVAPSDTKLRGVSWFDNDTIIYEASATIDNTFARTPWENFRVIAGDLVAGKSRIMLNVDGSQAYVTGARIEHLHPTKAGFVTMSTLDYDEAHARYQTGTHLTVNAKDSGWVDALFDVSVRTGEGHLTERGTPFTAQWLVNSAGAPLARAEWNEKDGTYAVYSSSSKGWKQIYTRNDHRWLTLGAVSTDGTAALAYGPDTDGRSKLFSLALDGSGTKVVVDDPEREVSGVALDEYDRSPVGVRYGPERLVDWTSEDMRSRSARLIKAFPGKDVRFESRSQDGTKMVARVSSPETAPVYYLVDFGARRAAIVVDEYPGLADAKLGTVKKLTYKARDGESIPALLTLPPGAGAQPLPMVVLPHGGPHAHDAYDFDWLAQFIASRGYAVLQPQFRGSTGYGAAFRDAGVGEWGGRMQDDVTDGVKAMIEQKVAIADRVAIVGASYGGYAALAGATLTPDLYRCAVGINGVYDLPRLVTWGERHGAGSENAAQLFDEHDIGLPLDPKIAARSPARQAAAVKIPVLLMHSDGDSVVPAEQEELMELGLTEAKKNFSVLQLKGDDHWLSQSGTRVQVLVALEAFLKQNL